MEDVLRTLVEVLTLVVAPIILLGAAAAAFGADSRPGIGDDHGAHHRPDWI